MLDDLWRKTMSLERNWRHTPTVAAPARSGHRLNVSMPYYICSRRIKSGAESCAVRSIAASEIEELVVAQVRRLLQAPEIAARTVAACTTADGAGPGAAANEREAMEALGRLDEVWEELLPG